MDNSKSYLLKTIAGYKTNGHSSFGQLDAKHVDDISKIMHNFAVETVKEVIERINKGEDIYLGDHLLIKGGK